MKYFFISFLFTVFQCGQFFCFILILYFVFLEMVLTQTWTCGYFWGEIFFCFFKLVLTFFITFKNGSNTIVTCLANFTFLRPYTEYYKKMFKNRKLKFEYQEFGLDAPLTKY